MRRVALATSVVGCRSCGPRKCTSRHDAAVCLLCNAAPIDLKRQCRSLNTRCAEGNFALLRCAMAKALEAAFTCNPRMHKGCRLFYAKVNYLRFQRSAHCGIGLVLDCHCTQRAQFTASTHQRPTLHRQPGSRKPQAGIGANGRCAGALPGNFLNESRNNFLP